MTYLYGTLPQLELTAEAMSLQMDTNVASLVALVFFLASAATCLETFVDGVTLFAMVMFFFKIQLEQLVQNHHYWTVEYGAEPSTIGSSIVST